MVDKESQGLLTNLGWGVGVLFSVCILFDVLRYFFPKIYFYRESATKLQEWNDYDGTPLFAPPRPPNYPFGWVKPVLWYEERTLVKTHGLDAALYIRLLRMLAILFALLSFYNLIVLLPLYGTADNQYLPKTDSNRVVGVQKFSLSNVPDKDNRLWGTLVSELVVLAVIAIFVRHELNIHKVYRLAYRADSTRNPSNYAVIALDVPVEMRSAEKVRKFFVRCFPGEVAAVYHIRDAENLENGKQRVISAIARREKAQFRLLKANARHPDTEHEKLDQAVHDALVAQREAEKELLNMCSDLDNWAPLTHAAIVVFYRKRSATLAACTPLWRNAWEWRIERAAEPRAVNWNRIEITSWTSLIRTLITMGVISAFVILWFGPITALQALSNLVELSDLNRFSFLKPLVQSESPKARLFVGFVEGVLPPLLLFVLLQLIPMLFRFIIGFERIPHKGHFEAKIRTYLFMFYITSNFFYVVLTGSVLQKLTSLLNNPREIVSLLSSTVPAQATFLMKYVLINSFLGSALGLLNLGRLLLCPLMMFGARTTRAKRGADAIFSAYPFFKMHALVQMIALISIIYSTIAPLICLVATCYFSIAYVCTKFVIMYSHRPFFETGGHMYPGSCYALLLAVYIHQLVLVGIFILKQAYPQAVICFLALLLTVGFSMYCFKNFFRISRNGSMIDQMDADDSCGLIDSVPPHFIDLYLHPGMQPLETEDLMGLPRELRSTASLPLRSDDTLGNRTELYQSEKIESSGVDLSIASM